MGNLSLKYIYPSFKQMVGAGTPVVTVLMSIAFTDFKHNLCTWVSILLICCGLCVCTAEEVNYNFLGLVLSVGAMLLRSGKSIVQTKLVGKEENIDPVLLLYYMSPYSALIVLGMSFAIEGMEPIKLVVQGAEDFNGLSTTLDTDHTGGASFAMLILLLSLSGINACLLNLSGFYVSRFTSAVTLQVLGSLKSCMGIALSVVILGNAVGDHQSIGLFLCLLGAWIYERRGSTAAQLRKNQEIKSDVTGPQKFARCMKATVVCTS